MLSAVPGKPFFFTGQTNDIITVVSLARNAGPNVPAFRYAAQPLVLSAVNVGQGITQPGVTFTVLGGRRRLSALAPFATNPPKGEFFFQEVLTQGNTVSLVLLGSVVPDDPTIAWTIEGL